MAVKKILLFAVILAAAGIYVTPGNCVASSFTISDACQGTVSGSSGSVDCSSWQKGSQANYKGIDVGTCICANTCLATPPNHYYYDNPVDKTRQNDENKITLPVVLAWDEVPGWQKTDGSYIWYWPEWSVGGSDSATSDVFAARSYLLEIDNTNSNLNDSKSAGGTFRKVLTTNEFNPQSLFYPCFFNAGTTYKWRVRPCCNEDGSNCQPESQSTWWTFTTSDAPEPIDPKDPNWNGSGGATEVSFDGLQVKWCRAFFQKTKKLASSYKLNVTSDESGAQECHPLMKIDGMCKDDEILPDPVTGQVYVFVDTDNIPKVPYPTFDQARQDHALFTRDRTYVWKVQSCYDDIAQECSDYGQAWTFTTKHDPIGTPEAHLPADDTTGGKLVGLPVSITWTMPDGANSFVYETSFISGSRNTSQTTAPNTTTSANDVALFDADNLKPSTTYKWRVRACSNFNSTNCDEWSPWFSFITTGRPPKANTLVATSDIPASFSWEAVEGAKSYNFSLQAAGGDPKITVINNQEILKKPAFVVNYPNIDQDTTYYWKVQTCAHNDGTVCGDWSAENSITTGEITTPLASSPAQGETVYADQLNHQFSWSEIKGSEAYHFKLTLVNPAEENCEQKEIEGITKQTVITEQMNCLGEYTMAVEACVDSQCKSVSPKGEWSFTLDQRTPTSKNSLAVCGSGYDNPDTPWNEREECTPKHIVLFVKIFIDFLLFKLSIFLLPFMIVATAGLFYSPFGTPGLLERVKTTWKAIGIGYLLLFFAWVIVGILLSIIGFQGLWWKIL